MKLSRAIIVAVFLTISTSVFAQSWPTVTIIDKYKNWKWDSVFVAHNKYISIAVVPQAAGRILEYNLGETPSLWVNPDMLGKSFIPTDEVRQDEWRNFGGYRLVPLPVNNCALDVNGNKTKRWPPPAIMGDSPYTASISTSAGGIKSINVLSGVQELPVPLFDTKLKAFSDPMPEEYLQYERSLYIEPGSSLVYIKHTLKNVGAEPVKRGIMTTSQHISRSKPELEDGENFVAYIPFNDAYKLPGGEQYNIGATPESRWRFVNRNRIPLDENNPEHIRKYLNHGTNWTGEVAKGIFELHYDYYLMAGFHIISSESWTCYVNMNNNTAFAKIFEPYDSELEYEDGTNFSVYNSGLLSGYLETEVRTPLHTLHPGESFEYHEIHGAAKIESTPVLSVNETGIVTQRLSFDTKMKTISGAYGVFIEGIAVLQISDKSGRTIEEIILEHVDPLCAFSLEQSYRKKRRATKVQLFVKSTDEAYRLLDFFSFE